MEKIQYYNVDFNLNSCTKAVDKIALIDTLLDSLYTKAIAAVTNGDIAEYSLDTGQTVVKTKYRSMEELEKAISGYERLRKMLQADALPRKIKLIPGSSFNNR